MDVYVINAKVSLYPPSQRKPGLTLTAEFFAMLEVSRNLRKSCSQGETQSGLGLDMVLLGARPWQVGGGAPTHGGENDQHLRLLRTVLRN